jgi:hypothetical protein
VYFGIGLIVSTIKFWNYLGDNVMKIISTVVFTTMMSLTTMYSYVVCAQPASSMTNCISHEQSSSLRQLANEIPNNEWYKKLSALAINLKEARINCIPQYDMETLFRMLRSDAETKRFFAAMIIANVGPNARDAIPALGAALAERPCEDKTVTSAHAIRLALRKLGENPPPPAC